ncbi:nucleotide disphospho-sugar-binding domain-containing protein [Rhizobium sp. BK251]|uniref:glycosyltransferase n=1 Tax=Rhizobium sp. BK251 TaxID=2512125 RepID=UPI0010519F91|nr:nucleotide disphospho-sugar-binding domain-containing protein [Rhizobium sp. BK251]TCL67195.1 MGT family glycosyltransferase [Rhizobium sp. BK251]
MKILFAAAPFGGHINPLLGVAHQLSQRGYDTAFYTGTAMLQTVRQAGIDAFAFPSEVDFDASDLDRAFPERKQRSAGIERVVFDFTSFFIGPMASHYHRLQQVLEAFDADAIVYEQLFFGAIPFLFQPRYERPALIGCGITFLTTPRQDHAPHGPALPFATDEATRLSYQNEALPSVAKAREPLQDLYAQELAKLGVNAENTSFGNVGTLKADAYWQMTVPSFEYPQDVVATNIIFTGAIPQVPSNTQLPHWAGDLAQFERVVLVTQGTVANEDFKALVQPTLDALADEPDTLVIVTAGGRNADAIDGDIPRNARIASYLPFDWLLPQIDLLITNGGYGTVTQALAAGVPIIVAGSTEDKPEVAARIAWSGVGINLQTGSPTPQAIRDAYRRIFAESTFRDRVRALQDEFGRIDGMARIERSLATVVAQKEEAPAQRTV